ncbi:MAG: aromatic ring-hydroxylating dioxygenase subunit alpha [Pseudomonadota bacterium]
MLSSDMITAINLDTANATGMPNKAYTDADFLLAERERVFAPNWACLAFESSMPQPGHAKPFNFIGLPLMAARDDDGELRIFHNVCSHRGQILVHGECRMRGGLKCPYHAWNYAPNGELRGTPHIGGTGVHEIAQFDRSKHGLKRVRSAIWMGMVFVNLSGTAEAFDDYIAPLKARWEAFCGDGELAKVGAITRCEPQCMTLDTNWKLAVENFCESYHLPWVHPELNRVSRLSDHYNITLNHNFAGQGSNAYTRSGETDSQLPAFTNWPVEKIKQAEYIAFYPNLLLGIHADHAFAMIVEPLAHNRSAEYWQLFYIDESATSDHLSDTHESLLGFWRDVFAEDIDAVEGMQRGRSSPGFGGGAFSAVMDVPTHHFHRWVANCFTDNAAQERSLS